jgi:hypothetical protein
MAKNKGIDDPKVQATTEDVNGKGLLKEGGIQDPRIGMLHLRCY